MYTLLLEFLLSILLFLSISVSPTQAVAVKEKKSPRENCTKRSNLTYDAPGTLDYPIGDEDYNTNLLGDPVNELHQEKDGDYQAFDKGKCPKPTTGPLEDVHKPCKGPGKADPIEILYTSDSLVTPVVQCKKCNLFLTSDGQAVVVHCTDCFEIPVTDGKKEIIKRDITCMAFFIEIANYSTYSNANEFFERYV